MSAVNEPRGTADHREDRQDENDPEWLTALVEATLQRRPTWPPGLIAAAARRAARRASPQRTTVALLCVATAHDTKTPHRVLSDGWWWDENDTRYQTAVAQLAEAS